MFNQKRKSYANTISDFKVITIFSEIVDLHRNFIELSKVKSFTCDTLQDLVPLVQFKKRREKRQRLSVTFSKVADF